jgi:undecaprenyl-diphosphatase
MKKAESLKSGFLLIKKCNISLAILSSCIIRLIKHKVMKGREHMQQFSKNKPDEKTKKLFTYIGLIALLPFLYFAIVGFIDWTNTTRIDYEIGAYFYELRNPMRNTIATGITRLADREAQTIVTVVGVVILLIAKKWRTGLWYGLTVLIGSDFLNSAVKEIYQRIRPTEVEHLIDQGGYAFPSGHAMGAMIVYGGLLFIIIRFLNSKRQSKDWVKWVLSIFLGLLILMIGLSRIYLGVHYPSDVIGGFSLGFAWLALSIILLGLKFTREEFQPNNKYHFVNY